MKHCIDCRHYVHNAKNLEYGLCRVSETRNLHSDRYQKWVVSGEGDEPVDRKFPMCYCSNLRQPGGQCGPEAKNFEPHLLNAAGAYSGESARVSQVTDNATRPPAAPIGRSKY